MEPKMNKEEKRKMKTLELNSKEDFQYYLYQLICRSYKLIRQQDIYLLRLDNYICQKQRENVLMVTKNISVPYDVYKDFLALLGHVETNLLNILGDMQSSSMSYYKFRDIYRKRESRKAVDFQLAPLSEDVLDMLKLFNMSRNFQNHMPESLITVEREIIKDRGFEIETMNPLVIVEYETCTLEFVIDMYKSYKEMNRMAKEVFEVMKKDMSSFLGAELQIIENMATKSKGIEHLEPVKKSADIQGL